MQNLAQLRCIGKASAPWQKEAVHTYAERYRPFGRLEVLEYPEGHEKSAKPDIVRARAMEADSLLHRLPDPAVYIALDASGSQMDSDAFASFLEDQGVKPICFFIGGSWGLDPRVLKKSHFVLSLGKMTYPHLLARILLLEQLYRAQTILRGKAYHK